MSRSPTGREISSEPPLLVMAAPALYVHPTTDTLLRYVSPQIEWRLLGVDERWRKELRVVFRKHPEREERPIKAAQLITDN